MCTNVVIYALVLTSYIAMHVYICTIFLMYNIANMHIHTTVHVAIYVESNLPFGKHILDD